MINIKVEKFEGPLSLLLKMIESEDLDITEVSLAKIANQYVEYIKCSGEIDIEQTADFLVIAAKLLYIKSKALLPYLFSEEDEDIEELENQLKMFKEFLEAAKKISKIIRKKRFMFSPPDRKASRAQVMAHGDVFSPPKKLKENDLKEVFKEFIDRKKPMLKRLEEDIIEHKVSLEDKILIIEKTLIEKIKFSFNEFLAKSESKTEVIVSFLAILELMKQKSLDACQSGLFNEILISKKDK